MVHRVHWEQDCQGQYRPALQRVLALRSHQSREEWQHHPHQIAALRRQWQQFVVSKQYFFTAPSRTSVGDGLREWERASQSGPITAGRGVGGLGGPGRSGDI